MDTAGSGAGPGREPTVHTRALTHGHVGGGAQDPCTRLHVGSTYTQTRASPMAAGPTPAHWAPSRNHTHRGAGLVWSHPCPHRPPLPGSLALEAPETPPAPGGGCTICPPVFPAGRTLRRQDCPWGLSMPPHPGTRSTAACRAPSWLQTPQECPQHREDRDEGWGRGTAQKASGSLASHHLRLVLPSLPPAPSPGLQEAKCRSPASVAGKGCPAVCARAWAVRVGAGVQHVPVCPARTAAACTLVGWAVALAPKA